MKKYPLLYLLLLAMSFSVHAKTNEYITYITVAQDGAGDFNTVQQAVDSCKSFPDERITIFVKDGTYNEKVVIHSWNSNIILKGESKKGTIITYHDKAGKNQDSRYSDVKNGTFYTYTVKVCGNDFMAENLTIENSSPVGGQAVALHIEADRVVIRDCDILGHQDTVCLLYTSPSPRDRGLSRMPSSA